MPYINATVKIQYIIGTQRTKQHALCDTKQLSDASETLNYIRFHFACTALVQGNEVTTDEYGNATFSNFSIIRGPIGQYDLTFYANKIQSEQVSVFYDSPITSIECLNTPQSYANLNIPLFPQPIVRVLGINKQPIKGVKVYAISLSNPKMSESNIYYYKLNGKRFALLKSIESEESDENGIARFRNLTIIASTDEIVYIHFCVNGLIMEWSTKNYKLPQPIFPYPIILKSVEAQITFANEFSRTINEGEIIGPIALKIVGKNNNPIVGIGSVAILTEFCNEVFPNNYVFLSSKRKAKDLLYPIAARYPYNFEDPIYNDNIDYLTTDNNGYITFDKLRFSQSGSTINGSCLGKVEFYVGNAKTDQIAFIVKSVVSAVVFEKFYDASHSNSKQYSIWKIIDKQGKGIKGKMAYSIEFVNDGAVNAEIVRLNITNAMEAISDSMGIMIVEFEPTFIKESMKGRIKIVVDGIIALSSSISYSYPSICTSKISFYTKPMPLKIITYWFELESYDLCGNNIDTRIYKYETGKALCEYGFQRIIPLNLMISGVPVLLPNVGRFQLNFQKTIRGSYTYSLSIFVANEYFSGQIPLSLDFSFNGGNIGSLHLVGNYSLDNEIWIEKNSDFHITVKSSNRRSLEMVDIDNIYIIPLDIPKCLINIYTLYWFTVKIIKIRSVIYNPINDTIEAIISIFHFGCYTIAVQIEDSMSLPFRICVDTPNINIYIDENYNSMTYMDPSDLLKYRINVVAKYDNGSLVDFVTITANIEGLNSAIGILDYFAGSTQNETNDETFIATDGMRMIAENPSEFVCNILDANQNNVCFRYIFYTGSPSWYYKSKKSKPFCFLLHNNEIHLATFPKYISYNYEFKIVIYIYQPNRIIETYKLVAQSTDSSNGNNMDNYIIGGEATSGFSLIESSNQFHLGFQFYTQIIFTIKWIGPLNVKYLTFQIYTPLYTSMNFTSCPINIVTHPNAIFSRLNPELDVVYVLDRISLPTTAKSYSYPVNNALLHLFVQDYNSPESYEIGNSLFAIYMILLGENRLFDYISSPNCALSANTSTQYTDTNGNALFWAYFEKGKPGKYTIYIRYNSLFVEAKSIILKNKISKVILQNNITQIINVPFTKLNNIINPQTVTLTLSPVLGVIDENKIPIKDKENSIKAYIFNADDVNKAIANKHIAKERLIISDFETSIYTLNGTKQHLGILIISILTKNSGKSNKYTKAI